MKKVYLILSFILLNPYELKADDYLYLKYQANITSGIESIEKDLLKNNLTNNEKKLVKKNLWGNEKSYSHETFEADRSYHVYLPQNLVDPVKLENYLLGKNEFTRSKLKIPEVKLPSKHKTTYGIQIGANTEDVDSNTSTDHLKTEKTQMKMGFSLYNLTERISLEGYSTAGAESGDYGLGTTYWFKNAFSSDSTNFYLGIQYMHAKTFSSTSSSSVQGRESMDGAYVGFEVKKRLNSSMRLFQDFGIKTYYYYTLYSQHKDYAGTTTNLPGDFIGLQIGAKLFGNYRWVFEGSKKYFRSTNAINFTTLVLGVEYNWGI